MTEIEKRGFVKEYPIDLKKKDGTIISAFVTAAVRKDKNDNMIGYQGIIRDITERKLAEEKQKRLFREHQRLSRRLVEVQEMERRHIARELHDRISQNLTAVGINLNIFQNQLSAPLNPKIEAQLNDSMKLVEEMTVCIRDLMAELHPAVLDDYGLLAALHWYGERFSARTGIMIVLEGKELTPRLPLEVEIALFRIAQEALTNVVKYAQTDRVTVTLDRMTGGARLTIVDEGVGFDPKTLYQLKERSGWGLITMRERAEAVGGRLLMESSPGKGTKVIVEVLRWAIDFVKSPALPGDM